MAITVAQVQSHFNHEYFSLLEEIEFMDTQFEIFKAWMLDIGVQLKRKYSKEELILLHGLENSLDKYTLKIKNDKFNLMLENEIIVTFEICEHNFYTPITKYKPNRFGNYCLKC